MITTPAVQNKLLDHYQTVRSQSEAICAPLEKEDYVAQPVEFVSPPKWHLGHTTWFFEQFLLKDFLPGYEVFHPRYAYVFNSYYEGAGKRIQRATRGNLTRPTVDKVYQYRAYVDQKVAELLQTVGATNEIHYIITLGLHHEQQHQELLFYDIQYILGHNPLFPTYAKSEVEITESIAARGENYLEMKAGLYPIGYAGKDFHWDNEEGEHQVYLGAYRIMDRLVTNGEYLAFMQVGGYQSYQYWLEEGWRWVNENKVDSPMYWYPIEGQWHQFTLQGMKPVDLHAPVTHISYFEAQAYANWKGKRLPTEFEWEAACKHYEAEIPPAANFVEAGHFHPRPAWGHYQFYGDGWEWTQSAYLPYPHYQAPEGTLGEYNGKFMVNQMVLRGGSCATPRNHIRPTYRNFFHPNMRWQFTALRLAE
jgi:ergothioneine biosynthesis protein EgtB